MTAIIISILILALIASIISIVVIRKTYKKRIKSMQSTILINYSEINDIKNQLKNSKEMVKSVQQRNITFMFIAATVYDKLDRKHRQLTEAHTELQRRHDLLIRKMDARTKESVRKDAAAQKNVDHLKKARKVIRQVNSEPIIIGRRWMPVEENGLKQVV